MQVSSQYPIVFRSGASQPGAKPSSSDTLQSLPAKMSANKSVSSLNEFDAVHSANASARFHRIHDLDATTQAALQAYKNTEALASNNPRHALIGVDVFA